VRRVRYQVKGAKIGVLTILGEIDLAGRAGNLHIGTRSVLGSQVHLALHERIIIGSNVVINDGTQLLTASHDVTDPAWQMFAKAIEIEDFVWIARSVIILPGVKIGRGAVVGAGAVVSKDVPAFGIVVGNPAKLIEKRRTELLNYSAATMVPCYEAWLGKLNQNAGNSI
jgi:maltose O-acetyltransferase